MADAPLLPFRLQAPVGGRVDLLIVAGEHSGDEHAARAVRELQGDHPDLKVCALGGDKLAAAGAQLLHDLTASSVVGLVEVLKNYSFFKALFGEVLRWIDEHRPRAVCLVDYPGFNLRLARALRERGISVKGGGGTRVLYYISPQIWAWKARRRFTMARDLDALAVIFPFEVDCYADTDLSVDFVGHPFVASDYEPPVNYDAGAPILLLPGSRKQAVGRIFPVLLKGLAAFGNPAATVLYPSEDIHAVLREAHPPEQVSLVPTGVPVGASAVLTSSGTMSMHCALAGIPGAIAYRANPLTYILGRMLVQVEYLGIANLLLKEPMYPEYIQGAASAEALAGELTACARDSVRLERVQEQSAKLRDLLLQPSGESIAKWLWRRMEME